MSFLLDIISLWEAQTNNFVRWIKKQLYNNKFFRIYNELPRYSEKNNQIKFLREIPNKVFNIHLSFAKLKMSKVKALEISNKLNCVLWRNYCYLGFDCSLSKLKICMYNLPSRTDDAFSISHILFDIYLSLLPASLDEIWWWVDSLDGLSAVVLKFELDTCDDAFRCSLPPAGAPGETALEE